jgi:membrane protein required for colicin V production
MPSFTILDVVVAIVLLFSGFLAMLRGLTREILSIVAWAAAAGAAYIVFFHYKEDVVQYAPDSVPEIVAVGGAAGVAFLLVLIFVSLLTIKIGDWVLDSSVGALDRTLGLLFGLARGMILIGIIFWLAFKLTNGKPMPDYVNDAYSIGAIEWTRDRLDILGKKIVDRIMIMQGKGGEEDDLAIDGQ